MAELLRIAREHFVRNGYRATTMSEVAAAAGITKRTLYSWHNDKEALFKACVLEGAERFPQPDIDNESDVGSALRNYVVALVRELAVENSFGMGRLFLQEAREFPELATVIERSHAQYVIEPLAAYLRKHGLEREGSTERTFLFIAMALAPIHNILLLGAPSPDADTIERNAALAVDIFVH